MNEIMLKVLNQHGQGKAFSQTDIENIEYLAKNNERQLNMGALVSLVKAPNEFIKFCIQRHIYGEKVYILYNDVCKQDNSILLRVMSYMDAGRFSDNYLNSFMQTSTAITEYDLQRAENFSQFTDDKVHSASKKCVVLNNNSPLRLPRELLFKNLKEDVLNEISNVMLPGIVYHIQFIETSRVIQSGGSTEFEVIAYVAVARK